MIDLHLHTTASDGTCSPAELVHLASQVGLTVIGIADHDTMAAVPAVSAAARDHGIEVVPGIEITAVHDGRDVHVLAYHLRPAAPELETLLTRHRAQRLERAQEIARRLARAGVPIDMDALLASMPVNGGKAVARPQIARALVVAGHVDTVAAAFDRYLGEGCCAYVPHDGASPHEIVRLIDRVGGVTSLAHPGTLDRDELVPQLADAGLTAIEARHSAHSPEQEAHYRALAKRFDLSVTGGSDFHGPNTRRSEAFGRLSLPREDYEQFERVVRARCAA